MGTQFRMGCVPGSLIVVGGTYEPWLSVLEQAGWKCTQCADLRKADQMFSEVGPCIGIVDLSHDEFSLNGVANLVSSHKQVRWLAFIREPQLRSDTICQFIVNFCIDFFTAPIPDTQLLSTIGHQLGMLQLEKKVWPDYGNHTDMGLLGESMAMKRLRDQIKRIAPTDVSILISGESGAGKETVAKAIHKTSSRSQNPFITINCRAMAEKRLEQELFGIDSSGSTPSLLQQAHGGTLLLNDILALPKSQQWNLLRFLQEGKINTPQGSQPIDVRILAAHSMDIEKALIDGDFNEELYHYINVLRIQVPSLKDRGGDIALLANHFLKEYAKEYNAQARSFSEEALLLLARYHWPGNVRELMNQIKRVVLMSDTVMLDECHLDLPKRIENKRTLKSIRERSEREALVQVLESHDGQVSNAAKELGISRATIYRLLNKHNLMTDFIF
ncbi:cyclic-di-GMP-binding transcriptional regulator VpsR [Vibrio cincinnatiensis]|jgi:DNA-binding NtrC family response regulator|uniref:DNA-binding transcriptional response regulator, NtrC family, contains REC, AAA-type ATPase, and a Fis-type DNA-binding domains n=1 Tax=Vibrio cincinnatiensis DSM 19608 TaxID=1123491 RepID=A0A1T4PFZ5_VIBCI|nr:cyclic-di-GMP-binding transcriptional regulator VpsR [Vibrio cincinnatiensis]MCG3721663.1 sigma-54-dependent Fis family transcriptional regulator [Vibrio cincinnatiensis]MCG3742611.1 sigma-54-dependent Fis family transcriptional regulator [Vibrio cincinnatiensis]SJZ90490.1 DNA-binding transcriptional response regulator, NtrC family, contains REC, AAA-type ATPase, and a Fis-type DNA-binding domains [Vibrio cincinnatiensis DSM 19608]SUP47785.1 sigma-54 dependent transcriptional regulator [Vibr